MSQHPAAVELSALSVAYGSHVVLRDVDIAFEAGMVTALIGANGAGKSTLIKALCGVNPQYNGEIRLNGGLVNLQTPTDAKRAGISTVHQKVADGIIGGLSVAENIMLTELTRPFTNFVVNNKKIIDEAQRVCKEIGINWPKWFLKSDVSRLSISDAQMVTLARALQGQPRLLILDEPTSALSTSEVNRLFTILHKLKKEGNVAVVYVSHRFGEIETLADKAIVLRDGTVKSINYRPFNWEQVLYDMLGKQSSRKQSQGGGNHGIENVLSITHCKLFDDSPTIDLTIKEGEILGVLGLVGAGKTELAEIIAGLRDANNAELRLNGSNYRPRRPADAISSGIIMVPEDRQAQSILPGWPIEKIISLPFLNKYSKIGIINRQQEGKFADQVVNTFNIVTKNRSSEIENLSGGNQQKVVVGRWLLTNPKIAILDEPFRGVDIGARRDIGKQARLLTQSGSAVIVLSSDPDEIMEIADRVIVLVQGTITLDTYIEDVNENTIIRSFAPPANN